MNRILLLCCMAFAACSPTKKETPMTTQTADTLIAKPRVFLLSNAAGTKMTVTNFGAKVIGLWVPDKNGLMGDIVLGYDSATQYIKGDPYFGATIGRYGNRIAN